MEQRNNPRQNQPDGVYHFAEYTLDVPDRRLSKAGVPVKLQDKPLTVLIVLVAGAGRLVSRRALSDALWGPEAFVDAESGLNTAVKKLRNALGDSAARPRYIETVPGRGYRFVMEQELEVSAQTSSSWTPSRRTRRSTTIRLRMAAGLLVVLSMMLVGRPVSERGSGGVLGNKSSEAASLACANETTLRVAVVEFQSELGEDLGGLVAAVRDDVVGALWDIDSLRFAARPIADFESVSPADSDVVLVGRLHRTDAEIFLSIRLLEPEGLKPLWQRTFRAPRHEPYLFRSRVAETVASFLEGSLST